MKLKKYLNFNQLHILKYDYLAVAIWVSFLLVPKSSGNDP
jgi:hypothetical protein